MSTDNNTGIQMRAMAQCIENKANPEQLQGAPNPAMNPTVVTQDQGGGHQGIRMTAQHHHP